jgi:hypothetical protein
MVSCKICGRKLTLPESIRRGIGPICWARKQRELEDRDKWENELERYRRMKESDNGSDSTPPLSTYLQGA